MSRTADAAWSRAHPNREALERLATFTADARREPVALPGEDGVPRDDRLRLMFTCCHPSLSLESQVALTLRMVGGLETDEIARAFLASRSATAQRLVRAKRKIRDAGIPFRVPRAGLSLMAGIVARGELEDYHLLEAGRAELLVRDGRPEEAEHSFRRAIEACTGPVQREYLRRRLARTRT